MNVNNAKLLFVQIQNTNGSLTITFENNVKKTISLSAPSTYGIIKLYFGAIGYLPKYNNVSSNESSYQFYDFIFIDGLSNVDDLYTLQWGAKSILYKGGEIYAKKDEKIAYRSLTPLKVKNITTGANAIDRIILVQQYY